MTEIVNRAYGGVDDIARITQFLLDTYRLNQALHNWEPRRWIGHIYHRDAAAHRECLAKLPDDVRIWEDAAGEIVGAVTPEYDGGVYLQVHPDYRSLEGEMLAWAEANLIQTDEVGQRWLHVWAFGDDAIRNELLRKRGYTQDESHEVLRRRDMTMPISGVVLPNGYVVRSMRRDAADRQGMGDLLNAAFGRTFHSAGEYETFQTAPFYDPEYDIVVEAPDGQLAANAGFMVHPDISFAMLEPVCTHPAHHGMGLASAAITEGLRRIQALHIQAAYVNGWYSNPVSNHLYQKLGFEVAGLQYQWVYGGD